MQGVWGVKIQTLKTKTKNKQTKNQSMKRIFRNII
jgi:hypothetical protein